nr:diguanylate cyclase [Candidatus Electrothrix aestuarii]
MKSLYKNEFAFLEYARKVLEDPDLSLATLRCKYSEMLAEHEVLLRKVVKMTGVSDRAQRELKRLNIELQDVNKELENLSQTDGLTGLHNRRFFDTRLRHEWNRHCRNHSPLSLIMCDIDYFKKYNDTYGHHEGDQCLKRVAQAIQENLKRSFDTAVRYGGEEFAIILSETDSEGATTVARSIQNNIAKLDLPHSASKANSAVSMSYGVATVVPDQGSSPDTLICLADNALYQSKEKGRNMISVR